MPTCYKDVCPGHREDDLLPMGNFMDEGENYTNMAFYTFTSPYNEDLPYVYDSFDYWPACSSQGKTWFDDDDFVVDDDTGSSGGGRSSGGGHSRGGRHGGGYW